MLIRPPDVDKIALMDKSLHHAKLLSLQCKLAKLDRNTGDIKADRLLLVRFSDIGTSSCMKSEVRTVPGVYFSESNMSII